MLKRTGENCGADQTITAEHVYLEFLLQHLILYTVAVAFFYFIENSNKQDEGM